MKKKLICLCLCAMLLITGAGCADKGKKTYNEPALNGGLQWEEGLPLVRFPVAAEKVDYIDTQSLNYDVQLLLASVKSIVNAVQPRIYTNESTLNYITGTQAIPSVVEPLINRNWLDRLGCDYEVYTDAFTLVEKYKSEFSEAVIYDPEIVDTMNLASTYAGIHGAVAVSPLIYARLVQIGIKPKIIEDYRGRFKTKLEVYEYLYNEVWPDCTHRLITCISNDFPGKVRDYAMASKSAIVWLDSLVAEEKRMMEKFFSDMIPGESAFLGWFPAGNEGPFITLASQYGVFAVPSDYCENFTFFSGWGEVTPAKLADIPELEDKIYVSVVISDGDNHQYMQHRMLEWWETWKVRMQYGMMDTFPVAWSVSPSASVTQAGLLNWYFTDSTQIAEGVTVRDLASFMTGPSGIGYNYPGFWKNKDAVKKIYAMTDKYCGKTGIAVVNNWNYGNDWTIGLTSQEKANMYSEYKNVLAVYDQSEMTGTNADNGLLIGHLTLPYTFEGNDESEAVSYVSDAVDVFTGRGKKGAVFVKLQFNPWDTLEAQKVDMLETIQKLYRRVKHPETDRDRNTFADYGDIIEFARIDEMAMLERQANGLSATR